VRNERADAYLNFYEYRAMGCLTNARNQKFLTVIFSMNGAPIALYAGIFAKGCGQSSMLPRTIASMNRRPYPSTRSYHAG